MKRVFLWFLLMLLIGVVGCGSETAPTDSKNAKSRLQLPDK